ncbi:C40 family peptidase [Dictyobacter aurantiacus]|uniref:NLP/P60 n=1 Tax=Dictyobacter aurantiacus TaxID=1936993 RepID=A0A401ZGZ8_9CHLR|nr:C40 family peptidase [Dictyobacter aurantiacus]GCE06164.1 NLP/P60 [Dictyobacter aurantiacus]
METTDTTSFIVAVSVADIRREPDPNSELVTQALMNVSAIAGENSGEWTHVQLSDYSGWIRSNELDLPIVRGVCDGDDGTCGVPLPYSAVVILPEAPVYADAEGDEKLLDLYLSTALPYINLTHPQRIRIALPGDAEGWITREAVELRSNSELYPLQDRAVVTGYAKAFLGVPYLWGGTSYRGIDCSGLVQLCYRMGGNIIPRDADQQYDFLKQSVDRQQMRAGDLIFFGSKSITHVGMALNSHEFIHAEGQDYNRVVINSFDPNHPQYHKRLDSIVWGIKRVRP